MLSGLIVSALKTALTVTRFGKRLGLREKSHRAPKGDSQDQDQDSHGKQDWRLLQTLRGSKPQVSWIACWSKARRLSPTRKGHWFNPSTAHADHRPFLPPLAGRPRTIVRAIQDRQ